jgi:hypothetical protein
MTKGELERIAVLEVLMEAGNKKWSSIEKKVDSLDGKVDAILIHQAKGSGALNLINRALPMIISLGAVIGAIVIR